ncbi:MAG TPA: diguanylate cyclase [Ilumatobacteraceae bacterium]|nr:diguanylate cyclase [Ilumatobacteraceae bacterium]
MSWLKNMETDHEALLTAIVEALPEPFFLLDRDGRYVAVLGGLDNARYHDGRSLVGKRMHDVLPVATADSFLARVHEALDTGLVVSYEYELSSDDVDGVERRDGVPDLLLFESQLARLPPTEGRADMVVWMIHNVTETKLAMRRLEQQQDALELQQAELERLARTDPLTGLLNRRSFFDEASTELHWVQRSGFPAVVISFDLDDFKTINDTRGHAAGDAVLRAVSDLLRAERRATDVIGRLGGEEFAIVVRGADVDEGRLLAERLRDAIATLEVVHDGEAISMTASFGVTQIRSVDVVLDDAIKRADAAMYAAKRLGRDRVETDPAPMATSSRPLPRSPVRTD